MHALPARIISLRTRVVSLRTATQWRLPLVCPAQHHRSIMMIGTGLKLQPTPDFFLCNECGVVERGDRKNTDNCNS